MTNTNAIYNVILLLVQKNRRKANSSSNIFNLLIDEQSMTSKYWSASTAEENKGLMLNCNEEMKLNEQSKKENDTISCSESIEENVVTIKANNMSENENNDANHHDASKSFEIYRSSHIKQRPDSLKLSFAYGSSTDLGKSVFSNSNVNQTKSLSVDGNKSHHGGKKSTSYDLWVNENASKVVNVSDGECKKLDLPGRVSFRYVKELLTRFFSSFFLPTFSMYYL